MMVRELIQKLIRLPNLDVPIGIQKAIICQGSSWTGQYYGGTEYEEIKEVKEIKGDDFATLNKIDEVYHIEIVPENIDNT